MTHTLSPGWATGVWGSMAVASVQASAQVVQSPEPVAIGLTYQTAALAEACKSTPTANHYCPVKETFQGYNALISRSLLAQ